MNEGASELDAMNLISHGVQLDLAAIAVTPRVLEMDRRLAACFQILPHAAHPHLRLLA
jgi:hypothetical protein